MSHLRVAKFMLESGESEAISLAAAAAAAAVVTVVAAAAAVAGQLAAAPAADRIINLGQV
jgi:hypothetical protein